jgi:ABC-2 type transport system permease protein
MTFAQTADKFCAILRRDLLTAVRYRAGFILAAASSVIELAAFYYLSRAIGPGFHPEGMNYFPFLLVGTGMYTFLVMGIRAFLRAVQDAQQAGTLEVLMSSSTPASTVIILSAASALIGGIVQFLLYVGLGFLLVGTPAPPLNLSACLLIFGLSVIVVIALGMIAAALQIAVQKGSAVLWIFGSGAWFLTGTLFPVATLPQPLRFASTFIPLTHSLTGMRMALLEGASISSLAPEIDLLALFALVLLPLGLGMFSFAIHRARLHGTLAFY